jgi:hypothetical protein
MARFTTTAAALVATVAVCAWAQESLVDDLKCQVCDYGARAWVRHGLREDLECLILSGKMPKDDQLLSLLPPLNSTLFSGPAECIEDGTISLAALEGIGGSLCRGLILHDFPFVEEFPADQEQQLDGEHQWHDPPEYFRQDAAAAGIQPMQPAHIRMVLSACDMTMNIRSPKHLKRYSALVKAAIRNADLRSFEEFIVKEDAQPLQAAMDAAENKVRDHAASSMIDDAEDALDKAVAFARQDAREKYITARKREEVYRAVLGTQKEFCSNACGDTFQRPPVEHRVRGWSATLKRL